LYQLRPPPEEGDLVFIASEAVITLQMSMLRAMRDRSDCKHVLLINGNRPDVGHDVLRTPRPWASRVKLTSRSRTRKAWSRRATVARCP
jgi:hypothetical protein